MKTIAEIVLTTIAAVLVTNIDHRKCVSIHMRGTLYTRTYWGGYTRNNMRLHAPAKPPTYRQRDNRLDPSTVAERLHSVLATAIRKESLELYVLAFAAAECLPAQKDATVACTPPVLGTTRTTGRQSCSSPNPRLLDTAVASALRR